MINQDDRREDYERLIPALMNLIGDRTYAEVERASGIANGTISKFIKQERFPSATMIKKLTVPEAKPQNGITFNSLMIAAGYLPSVDYVVDTSSGAVTIEMAPKRTGAQMGILSAYAERLAKMEVDRFAKVVSEKLLEASKGELGKNRAEALAYREAAYRGKENLPKGNEEIDLLVENVLKEVLGR